MSNENEMTKEQMAQVMIQAKPDSSNVDLRTRDRFGCWMPAHGAVSWNWRDFLFRIRPEPANPATVALTMEDLARMVVDGGWYRRVGDAEWAFVRVVVCQDWPQRNRDEYSRDPINGPWYPANAVPVELLPWRASK